MLEFQPLTLRDITVLRPYFHRQPSRICDSTIGGTFLWRDYFQTAYAEHNGSLFLRSTLPDTGEHFYSVPMDGDVPAALRLLKAHSDSLGQPLILSTVPEEELPMLRALWPDAQTETIPAWADYLYHADDLKTLEGKKYATQRNHISKFNRLYPDWRFGPITTDNLDAVRAFFAWFDENREKDAATYREDKRKAHEVLDNFSLYGFVGGALWVEDRIIAMTLGEVVADTLYVHIEKADTRYPGAYTMIVREFARYACTDGVRFINREDDAGDEGLRQSKLRWRPCGLLDKYQIRVE